VITSTERVLRTLRVLLRSGGATVGELAKRFKRSVKVARRDLLAIRRAGFRLQSTDEDHNRKRWRVVL